MLSVIDELGNVGGLSELALGAGFVVFFIILAPFRDLELAIKFKKIKDQICQQEKLLQDGE
jgi:hypothetical protein